MDISSLNFLTEFDQYLNVFYGIDALKLRILYRIMLKKNKIPYYPGGLKDRTFQLNNSNIEMENEIRQLLKDLNLNIDIKIEGGRINLTTLNVVIPIA